jgi:hypothetical protein
MLVQRKDTEVGDETKGMAVETIRFNSGPNAGHSRSTAHTTLSHRSRNCHYECHLNAVGDSTLELKDNPELLEVSGLTRLVTSLSDGAETRFRGNQRYPCQRGWWNSSRFVSGAFLWSF